MSNATSDAMSNITYSTMDEVVQKLNAIPQFMETSGYDRCSIMLKYMGNPEESLKVIHVAGTNGKGSVCAYLDSILRTAGYKVGLFTSPHLVDIRERIRIQGELIKEADFVSGFNRVMEVSKQAGREFAYFDIILGIAVDIFVKENVDFCIIETGLGGKLDGTNAITNKLLNVITGVSLEHTAVLGDTVEKIATEKAGIIGNGVPVVYMDKDEKVAQVIETRAEQVNSQAVAVGFKDITFIKNTGKSIDFSIHNRYYMNDCFSINTPAVYQVENCSVALTAIGYLMDMHLVDIDNKTLKEGVKNTFWSGRMECIGGNVYIDGAHNPEGIEAFVKSAQAITLGKKAWLLFSVVNDKDYSSMIRRICRSNVFCGFVVTELNGNRKMSGERIKNIFERYTDKEVVEIDSLQEAYEYAVSMANKEDGYCFCAGSLYLIGNIKKIEQSKGVNND